MVGRQVLELLDQQEILIVLERLKQLFQPVRSALDDPGRHLSRATLEPSGGDFRHVVDDPVGRLASGVHDTASAG